MRRNLWNAHFSNALILSDTPDRSQRHKLFRNGLTSFKANSVFEIGEIEILSLYCRWNRTQHSQSKGTGIVLTFLIIF